MQAIILAAGMGNRLGNLTSNKPKALVRVAERELILRLMDFLDAGNFSERIVVTGYMADAMAIFLKNHRPDTKVLHNPSYKVGSIRTIETALPHISGEFLLTNVDHIYPKRMMKKILENRSGLMAICDFDRKLEADDMKVKLDGARKISAISKTLSDYDCGYIGMTYCSKDMLPIYGNAVRETLKMQGEYANVEAVLGHLAEKRIPVNVHDSSSVGWLEVDTQEDLNRAESRLSSDPKFTL